MASQNILGFVNVNEMAKAYKDFLGLEKFGESAKPCATERVKHYIFVLTMNVYLQHKIYNLDCNIIITYHDPCSI